MATSIEAELGRRASDWLNRFAAEDVVYDLNNDTLYNKSTHTKISDFTPVGGSALAGTGRIFKYALDSGSYTANLFVRPYETKPSGWDPIKHGLIGLTRPVSYLPMMGLNAFLDTGPGGIDHYLAIPAHLFLDFPTYIFGYMRPITSFFKKHLSSYMGSALLYLGLHPVITAGIVAGAGIISGWMFVKNYQENSALTAAYAAQTQKNAPTTPAGFHKFATSYSLLQASQVTTTTQGWIEGLDTIAYIAYAIWVLTQASRGVYSNKFFTLLKSLDAKHDSLQPMLLKTGLTIERFQDLLKRIEKLPHHIRQRLHLMMVASHGNHEKNFRILHTDLLGHAAKDAELHRALQAIDMSSLRPAITPHLTEAQGLKGLFKTDMFYDLYSDLLFLIFLVIKTLVTLFL